MKIKREIIEESFKFREIKTSCLLQICGASLRFTYNMFFVPSLNMEVIVQNKSLFFSGLSYWENPKE